jgi:hypothetical protein
MDRTSCCKDEIRCKILELAAFLGKGKWPMAKIPKSPTYTIFKTLIDEIEKDPLHVF